MPIPDDAPVDVPRSGSAVVDVGGVPIKVTNLDKPFWPDVGLTKGDLLRYYMDVAPWLLPHVRDRAMVLRRYPHGAGGSSFFQKRIPSPHPDNVGICAIDHGDGNVIPFPVISDKAALLWAANLGCIDLNPWYARCGDVDRPDYLHFDLDPGDAPFARVRECALVLRDVLERLGMPVHCKTSGSKGIHVYVPIVWGPVQKQVWAVAKAVAVDVARAHPKTMTAEYARAKRPPGRVLVDYNQNRWGATLASVYSPRPTPLATVSMPVTWEELEDGVEIADFDVRNAVDRLKDVGDLWWPVHQDAPGRYDLGRALRG